MSNIEELKVELEAAEAAWRAARAARATWDAVYAAARAAADDAWNKVRELEKKIAKLEKNNDN